MPDGPEAPALHARPAESNIVPLGRAEALPEETGRFSIEARHAGFVSGVGMDGGEQWFQSFLNQLRPGESLTLRVALDSKTGLALGATASAPREALELRTRQLEQALREVAATAAPHFKLTSAESPADLPYSIELRPAGQRLCPDDLALNRPRPVGPGGDPGKASPPDEAPPLALRLSLHPERRPDFAAIASLMSRPALRGAVLELDLAIFQVDARHKRALRDMLTALRNRPYEVSLHLLNDRLLAQLRAWSVARCGLRLSARISSREKVDDAVVDMLCQAVFGPTRCTDAEAVDIDLAAAWPDLDLAFLGRLSAIPAAKARLDMRAKATPSARRARSLTLGTLDDDTPFALDEAARRQHIYMLGGTGTGKSTLMLNMIVQDMKAGRGVVLIDPHGDLWEKALRCVPDSRLDDLVLVHPTDERGAFTMNVLERLSDDREGEHGRVIDELLDFFKRSQWREVPDAFGPMFTNYFRNGLLLLLSADGDDASILDFTRVFSDDSYRRDLIGRCRNPDVVRFWQDIVAGAEYEARLSNHAPYVVCKMSPIVGNVHLKRILGANRSTLDFGRIIAQQQICLINLAQAQLAKEAARFLGGMITARLVASAKVSQVSIPDAQRKRVNVYMDEFQTYISHGLADGLAEVRKYGLNLVLANQSLSQLQSDRYQSEVAEAVMSNAANVIAFRIGIADAMRLAIRFEPALAPQHLARLPNYHAAGIVVRGSDISPPEVFATLPDPKPPRRRKPAAQMGETGRSLTGARKRLVRLIGERSAELEPAL